MSDRDCAAREARAILGVPVDADSTQVVRAYRRRARAVHPDVNSEQDAGAQFSALSAAYRVLRETTSAPAPVRADDDQAPVVEHLRHAAPAPGPIGGWPTEWEGRGVAWLVAGPVRVQPLPGHVQPTWTTGSGTVGHRPRARSSPDDDTKPVEPGHE